MLLNTVDAMPIKLVCFLLLAATTCGGQSIHASIGRFKIGKTPSTILYDLLSESSDSLHKITSLRQVQSGDFTVYELLKDNESLTSSDPYGTYCPVARILLLNKYLLDDISLTNVVLSFYNNVLVSFQCDYSAALERALMGKYGQPFTNSQSTKSICDSQLDVVRTMEWSSSSLLATITYRIAYDPACSKQTTGQFRVQDTKLVKQLMACSDSEQLKRINQVKPR